MSERYTMRKMPYEAPSYFDGNQWLQDDEVLARLNEQDKRIAELEAGQPHVVDPENYDYTSGGVAVRDLVNRGGECYVWFSPSLLDSWTISGKWAEGSHIPDRDLIPTPKASKEAALAARNPPHLPTTADDSEQEQG